MLKSFLRYGAIISQILRGLAAIEPLKKKKKKKKKNAKDKKRLFLYFALKLSVYQELLRPKFLWACGTRNLESPHNGVQGGLGVCGSGCLNYTFFLLQNHQ